MAALTSSSAMLCSARVAFQRAPFRLAARKAHGAESLGSASSNRFAQVSQGSVVKSRTFTQSSRQVMVMASNGETTAFEVYCKGAPEGGNPSTKGTTLDCPFSQRVMMTLGEKNVKFVKQLCDEQDLPKFLGDHHPAGKPLIPVVRDLQQDKWIGESDDIVTYIEKKYPDPKLGTPETCSSVGNGLFPDIFLDYLLAEGKEEDELRSKMEAKYKEIDEALGKSDGPYLSGKEPCSQCLNLAPQLYHIGIATDRIKGWPIPKEYENIFTFLSAMKSRPSWGPAAPVNDDVVEDGWRTKIKSKQES